MNYGYARVSTHEQLLDLQTDALTRAGCDQVFSDHGKSGTDDSREGLQDALQALQVGDTLCVWRLDRLGRSMRSLIDVVASIETIGADFESLSDGIDTSTSGGKLYFHMMGALAQFERDLISERTKAGLDAARARGRILGRPRKLTGQQIEHARVQLATGAETTRNMARILGVDRKTLERALKTRPAL